MNVPALRFKQDDGKDFPEWKEKLLGDLCSTFKSGSGITSEQIKNQGTYPVYGGNGLRGYSDSFTHDGFFVLIGRQGALCGNINRSVGKAYISEHAIAVNANEASDTEWLAQKLDLLNLNRLSESSAQPGLAVNKLIKLKLTVPSKTEQTKIANFLTAVDEKITHLTQKHDLLTQYKKGVMQQIFSQELRFKDDDGGEFSEWEEKSLDEVALSISNGLNLDQSVERTGHMVTRIETISDKKINLEKVGYVQTEQDISNYKLDVGDILFSNINSISHIGKVVFVDEDYQLYHGMNLLRIVINQTTNNSKFVFYQLSSERMKQNFETKANKAVNQASINQTELKKTELNIPSKSEQTQIANFLTAIDDKITANQTQLQAVKQHKQGLLQQMFV